MGKYSTRGPNMALDSNIVKRAHRNEQFTNEQIVEFAKCADLKNGYMHFLKNYFWIQHPVKGKMKFEPYDFQIRLLEIYNDHRYSVALLGRQLGKCLVSVTPVTIKNNSTGKIYDIPVEILYNYQKAKYNGLTLPDISIYQRLENLSEKDDPENTTNNQRKNL